MKSARPKQTYNVASGDIYTLICDLLARIFTDAV
jgi:hypothetical protein